MKLIVNSLALNRIKRLKADAELQTQVSRESQPSETVDGVGRSTHDSERDAG